MKPSDTDLINWLEKQFGIAVVSDDNGHWACVGDGFQTSPMGKQPQDIQTTFWIEKKQWRNSIRASIRAAMKEAK